MDGRTDAAWRRHGGAARLTALGAAVALSAALAACGDDAAPPMSELGGPDTRAADSLPAEAPLPPRGSQSHIAIQLGAFADSASARRLRDSLADAGWQTMLRRVTGDTAPPWRVRVAPTSDRELLQALVAGFAAHGRPAALVQDTATLRAPVVRVHPVNRGTRGMRAGVRWTLAPDGRSLVVVEDPVAAEGDPLPDGFLFAGERGPVVIQRDSVWDVAPDPTWGRVAYGRAFLVRAEGRDAVSATAWLQIAGRTNMEVAVVRRSAFPASGMSALFGFAQPMIEPVSPDSASRRGLRQAVTRPVPLAGGWRVRWSADGATLAVGLPPERAVRDDAAPSGWLAVDSHSYLARGDLPSYVALATVRWTDGPTVDVETAPVTTPRRLALAGATVESGGGWITVRSAVTGGERRVVGPGSALAATANGSFVLALAPVLPPPAAAPNAPPRPPQHRVRLVVYELLP